MTRLIKRTLMAEGGMKREIDWCDSRFYAIGPAH